MKSKLAIWSFILAVMPLIIGILHFLILRHLDIFRGESAIGYVIVIGMYFLAPFLGFILGIVALFKINENPKLEGKWFAIVAIVIPIILLIILKLN